MRKRGIIVPDYREVMAQTPDTTAVVDSVVIGIPENLLDQSSSTDSTTSKIPEGDGALPAEKGEGTMPEMPAGGGSTGTP
jgi:monofunctional biosynthetic peptidoglycan transglycosylase